MKNVLPETLPSGRNVDHITRRQEWCKSRGFQDHIVWIDGQHLTSFSISFVLIRCHASQAYIAQALVNYYRKSAQRKDIFFTGRVVPGYLRKCALHARQSEAAIGITSDGYMDVVIKRVECIKTSVRANLNGTEHTTLLDEYEGLFVESIKNMHECQHSDDENAEIM